MKNLLYVILSVSLLFNAFTAYIVLAKNPMKIQGDKSWTDLYTNDIDATYKFLNENLGIQVVKIPDNGKGIDYRVIKAKGGMFPYAGLMQIDKEHKQQGLKPHAAIYITVDDYDAMHKKFIEQGAKPELENIQVNNMKFGFYVIPGGLDIGIVQYL